MKKILLFGLLGFLLQSCGVKVVPLKGKYQSGSVKSKVDQSFDKVWDSVIDMVAETGVSVKMIDKNSGLIIADAASFYGLITIEDKKGAIVDPNAFIVREHVLNEMSPNLYNNATAVWNMRIKPQTDKSSVISVNMHSIKIETGSTVYLRGLSTGVFEKNIIDRIFDGIK